jgi:hypothetical protein
MLFRLIGGPLLVFALAIVLLPLGGAQAQEGAGGPVVPTAEFSSEVPGAGCSTKTGDTKCEVPVGTLFTLRLSLNSFFGFGDDNGNTVNGYTEFSAQVTYDQDLVRKDRDGTSEIVWPDCSFAPPEIVFPGLYEVSCDGFESTHIGGMLEVDFTCTTAASTGNFIQLNNLQLADDDDIEFFFSSPPNLSVNCVEPPLVGGAQAGLAGAATSSNATGAIAGASVAAAVVMLGAIVWNLRRRTRS